VLELVGWESAGSLPTIAEELGTTLAVEHVLGGLPVDREFIGGELEVSLEIGEVLAFTAAGTEPVGAGTALGSGDEHGPVLEPEEDRLG
jgi:hypothetical protein